MTYTDNRLTTLDADILDTIHGLIDRAAANEACSALTTEWAVRWSDPTIGDPRHTVMEKAYTEADARRRLASGGFDLGEVVSRTVTCGEWSPCSS